MGIPPEAKTDLPAFMTPTFTLKIFEKMLIEQAKKMVEIALGLHE